MLQAEHSSNSRTLISLIFSYGGTLARAQMRLMSVNREALTKSLFFVARCLGPGNGEIHFWFTESSVYNGIYERSYI